MAVTFLIGGTGNQLFEYASSEDHEKMSSIFLNSGLRRMLKWTDHEQIIEFTSPNPLEHIAALVVLIIDLILAKLLGISFLTLFDTRSIKIAPIITNFVRVGYFQEFPEKRSLAPIARQIAPRQNKGTIVLHIRGGDLLALEQSGNNVYGLPSEKYYQDAIKAASEKIKDSGGKPKSLLVLTDDIEYASSINLDVELVPRVELLHLDLKETFEVALGAEWFVSSNSTMSYWLIRLRQGKDCIAPKPFQKQADFDLPNSVLRLEVGYT